MSEKIYLKVLFFGSTAELSGTRCLDVEAAKNETVETVATRICSQFPPNYSSRLKFSLNQTWATGKENVQNGDELAIFTAVSGG